MKNSTFSAQVANNLLTLLQGYSKTIRLLLVMFLTLTVSAEVWGEDFEKYSGTITEGDYLIVYNNGAMNNTVSSSRLQYTEVTVSNNKISNPDASLIWHIAPNGSYWTIYNANVSKYAAGTGAKNKAQLLASGTDNKSLWTVSGTSTYEFVNKANKAASVNSNLRRNGTYGFACYATSTGGALTLYKKVTAVQTVAVTGVSLNQTSLTLTVGNSETLTATVLPNNATDKTITWSTSNSSVATVRNGEVTAVAEGSAIITVTTNDGNKTATCTVTVTPKPKYTVTLVPGSGSVTSTTLTETSTGAGVTLPTPTLDCGDWEFAGWAAASVGTETTTKPTLIAAGSYKPTANTTFYAVYKRTEETEGDGGTENVSRKYTFSSYTAGTQYAENEVHKLDNDVTLTTTDCHFTSELRIYSSSTNNGYVVSNNLPGRIVSIGVNAGNKVDELLVYGSTDGSGWTQAGSISVTSTSYKDYTLDFGETNYTYFKLDVKGSNQVRLKSITITWESTSAGGTITTTYYHSTPDCGTPTPTPTLNVDPATLTFGNTTTNTSTQKTFTLTGSNLTANAELALSGANASMFSVNPTSVTQSAGSIDQTITVTYAPTAAGNHTATLTISSADAESKTVTLSGVGSNPPTWQPATINFEGIIQVACGSTTVLNPADPNNGPATITFNGYDLQDSVKVTASEGFLVSTDKTTAGKYTTELTVNPHKDGNNIGKIQNVYVIAQAPAQSGDYDGTITLTGTDITGGSQTINVTANVECTQYTITWSVSGDTEMIEPTTFYAGDEWDLPENPNFDCNGREFVGWTTSEIIGETPNAPADLYKSKGDFPEINEDKTFYAVFATSSGDDSNETTVSVSIKNYAETNSWEDATQYTTINISSDITATAKGGSNTGKYYDNGKNWRLYQTETPTLTFNAANEYKILSITITYTSDKTGVLTFNGSNIDSGKAYEINATSAEFGVGNTGSATNGQVRITDISVTYSGGGHSGYTTNCDPCINSNFTISESNFTISKDSTLNLGALIQTENQSTIIYTCNTPNGTITADGLFSATESGTYTVTIHQDSDNQDHCAVNKTITIKVVGEIVTLKWSVNGATNTNLSPGTVEKNTPIGTLPVPKTGCDDKTFMGWTTTSTVNSDGSDIEYIKATTAPTENTTYYAVFASEGNQNSGDLEEIFYESFNKINGQGGNDEQWNSTDNQKVGAGTNAIDSLVSNFSWDITKGYEAYQCVKMGASSAQGIITTPAINQLNGNAVLTFRAGAWDNGEEKLDIIVEVSGGATISPSAFTLKKGQFDTYTANITGGSSESTITIKAKDASKNRFFIDDIRIAVGAVSFEDYTTRCGTYTVTYHGFGGYSTICGDNPAEKVVEVGSTFTVATCTPEDPKGLGRIFAGEWYTNPNGKGDTYKPGDTFVVEEDITLYAQWKLETTGDIELPADKEDLATTDIVVNGGHTLTLQAGTTTINSLTLKGGIQADGRYKMPIINIPDNATLKRKSDIIYLDLVVNAKNYYPFAVPFRAKNGSDKDNWDYVGYIDPDLKDAATYRTHFVIKTYDGAKRAENGENRDANWVIVNRDTYLEPGIGYMITAMTAGKDAVTMRIPMRVSDDWFAGGEQTTLDEVTRNTVSVTAHTGTATDINKGGHQRHAGWNFVANPYLSNFTGGTNSSNVEGSFINGEITINNGEYSYGGEKVPYVTIPTYDFARYDQVKLSEATLSPAYSFFVQVGESGTMTFKTAGRQAAPASIAARNAEERPVKMDVDITLSDNHSSDQTGIIISDRYSEAYEIGRDLEKLFGSAYNLSVYTLMADNTPLAFQALAIRSNMQVIPVGYRAPEQGEYTFRLNEATSSIDLLNEQYEQLVLVDYQTGELTNLLISDYTFYSERTQVDNRFAIYAVPRQNTPTDLPNAIGQDKQAQKIIHNGHLYILRDGNVYNGNGQIVK